MVIFIMGYKSFSVFLFIVCIGLVSAGFSSDVSGSITGNVILGGKNVTCEGVRNVFEENHTSYVIPEKVPFSNDVFAVYVNQEFFGLFDLVNKKITKVSCNLDEEVSYNIYITTDLLNSLSSGDLGEDVVGFYNEKKNSGELKIEGVGIGKKIKLSFINFGLKIFGWFN